MRSQACGKRARCRGQSLVEFALAVALFLLVTLGVMQFALLYHFRLVLDHTSREGARYAAIKGGPTGALLTDPDVSQQIKAWTLDRAGPLNPPLQADDITFSATTAQGDPAVQFSITYDVRPLVGLIAPLLPETMTFTRLAAMRLED